MCIRDRVYSLSRNFAVYAHVGEERQDLNVYVRVITLMGGGLVLYSSALVFGNFEPGFCFLLLWAASFPVIYTVKLVHFRNDHQSSFWLNQRFCTPGLLIFVTTYVGVYLYDLNRSFTNWDEFSHWGVMIKEMLRLNTFYSVDSSVLAVHKDYPPAIQIIEWLWCRLSGGCYEEAYLYSCLLYTSSCNEDPAANYFTRAS